VVDIAGTTHTLLQVHTDHLGRPTRMTTAAKSTVWQASYKPWGEVQTITGTVIQNLRFPGQYFQVETGLAYNWHRAYDPVTGRYTQPDPLRFVDGPSIYAYAGKSPWMNVDQEGRETITAGVNGNVVIGAGASASAGVLINWGLGTDQCADIGIYFSGSPSFGFGIGAGIEAGYNSGPASSVDGISLIGSAGLGPFTMSGSYSPGQQDLGYGGGVGVGIPFVSATVGASYTVSLTYQKIKSAYYWARGWGNSSCGCKR
jgi:RHS repeat-associated protein